MVGWVATLRIDHHETGAQAPGDIQQGAHHVPRESFYRPGIGDSPFRLAQAGLFGGNPQGRLSHHLLERTGDPVKPEWTARPGGKRRTGLSHGPWNLLPRRMKLTGKGNGKSQGDKHFRPSRGWWSSIYVSCVGSASQMYIEVHFCQRHPFIHMPASRCTSSDHLFVCCEDNLKWARVEFINSLMSGNKSGNPPRVKKARAHLHETSTCQHQNATAIHVNVFAYHPGKQIISKP